MPNLPQPKLFVVIATLALVGCGGGGGGERSSAPPAPPPPTANTTVSGHVSDGPLAGADVVAQSSTGVTIGSALSSAQARYALSLTTQSAQLPIVIRASGGNDLVTAGASALDLRSVVLTQGTGQTANINPFTTLIVHGASMSATGITAASVAQLRASVARDAGFGLTPARVADPLTTPLTGANAVYFLAAGESLRETLRRTQQALALTTPAPTMDDILIAVAADLTDGALDGRGASNASLMITATWHVVAGQVLLEALTNSLSVAGVPIAAAIDAAILVVTGQADALTSAQFTADAASIARLRQALAALAVVAQGDALSRLAVAVSRLAPGMSAVEIQALVPADAGDVFDAALALIPGASPDTLTRMAGDGEPVANSAPVISGAPATSVLQNAYYEFVPLASDADADPLVFSVANAPAWSTFDPATGQLSGTPSNVHVGTTADIRISVSDGNATAALPGFSLTVINVNDAPTISGTPATTVTRDSLYEFIPSAEDPDGDPVTFSIANMPVWAAFDPATGRLWGTPSAAQIGNYPAVTISVGDGELTGALPPFDVTVVDLPARSATVSWAPPSVNADQTPLTDLAGFRVYYSTAADSFTTFADVPDPAATTWTVQNLTPGNWFFVITAYDESGNESVFSNLVSKIIN